MLRRQHEPAYEFKLRVDPQEWNLNEFIFVVSDNNALYMNDGSDTSVILVSRTLSELVWKLSSCFQHPRVTVYGLEAVGYEQKNYKIVASGHCAIDRMPIFSCLKMTDDKNVYTVHLEKHGASKSFVRMFHSNEELDESDIQLTQGPLTYPSEYTVSNLPKRDPTLRGPQTLLVVRQVYDNEEFCVIKSGSNSAIDIGFPLSSVSMTKYEARAYMLETSWQKDRLHGHNISTSSKVLKFGTYMTQQDLQTLKQRAVTYFCGLRDKPVRLTHFWRDKPESYYTDIMNNKCGIMEKYRKDYNGDQSSWLNGNLDGLFFSAQLHPKKHKIRAFSFFGDTRFFVPVEHFFNDNHNLYFADFYCLRRLHYVTLVLAKKSSRADHQCRGRLLPLDICTNPFLHMKKFHTLRCEIESLNLTRDCMSPRASSQPCPCSVTVYTTVALSVEVFYTEDVDIKNLITINPSQFYFKKVKALSRGSNTPRGIPKNPDCSFCNL